MNAILLASLLSPVLPQAKGLPGEPGSLPFAEIRALLDDPASHRPYVPTAPLGLPSDLGPFVPADNPITRAKVELGRQLYFDRRLSRDGSVSCATCHDPARGFTDQAPVSTGIRGQKGDRSAPTVLNRLAGNPQFWDGRAASLEEQALGPIANPIEMDFTLPEAVERLKGIEGYRLQFEKCFGGVSAEAIAKAIASFERTVLFGGAPEDAYVAAEPFLREPVAADDPDRDLVRRQAEVLAAWKARSMSESALRGRALFYGKAKCSLCHSGVNFTDEQFYNIGTGAAGGKPKDVGREKTTKMESDRGAFKTPTLRQITDTGPYMHDGSEATLEAVVDYYDRGGTPNPWLSNRITKLGLAPEEKKDLAAYLREAFRGEGPKVEIPRLP